MSIFSKRLKYLREKSNYSQKKVAASLGISNVQLSRYESGDRNPDPDTLAHLADYFNVSVDYLLGRTDNPIRIDDDSINVSFRDGGEAITEEEAEYLEQQLKQFRELRKKFQKDNI